jgi:hypothetical protein
MHRLLYWISSLLPCRLINNGNGRYLERYYLGTIGGRRYYLHQFLGSDEDCGPHSHKWRNAWSIVLAGWYWEELRWGTRKVRWFNWITPDTFHRVVLPFADPSLTHLPESKKDGVYGYETWPCWTLFSHTVDEALPHWGHWKDLNDPDYPNAAVYLPYDYKREGSQVDWWTKAKTGAAMRKVGGA